MDVTESKPEDSKIQNMDVDNNGPLTNGNDDTKFIVSQDSSIVAVNSVLLHPLVILNISDHWTRFRAQEGADANINVMGALIGKQKGRIIELMNSFELKVDFIENTPILDTEFFKFKEHQFKQVFPDLEFLGWYANGDMPTQADIKMHKEILEINESSLFLKLNPLARNTGNLPIRIYESIVDLISYDSRLLFINVPYTLASEETERIVLDHMARMSSSSYISQNNSIVTEHLRVQHSAVKMLRDRIKIILNYIKDVKNKTIPKDHVILRDILNLCHRLPIMNPDYLNEEFYLQCNDVSLITYLGILTKCTNTINQFANKFNVLTDRPGPSRRIRF